MKHEYGSYRSKHNRYITLKDLEAEHTRLFCFRAAAGAPGLVTAAAAYSLPQPVALHPIRAHKNNATRSQEELIYTGIQAHSAWGSRAGVTSRLIGPEYDTITVRRSDSGLRFHYCASRAPTP